MRKFCTSVLVCLVFQISPYGFEAIAQTGPGGVGNSTGSGGQPRNKLWLRADAGVFNDAGSTAAADNDPVYQWNDQSFNGCTASQTNSGSRPSYKTGVLNGLPVIRFNGSSTEMLFGSSLDNSNALPMGFFAVTQGTTNPRGLFDSRPNQGDVFRFFSDGGNNNSVEFWNQSPYRSSLNLSSSGSVVSVIGSLNGSSNRQLDAYITGTPIGLVSGNTSPVGFTSCRLGSINQGTAGWFNGDVAEVVYFSTAVNAAQRIIVENYLGAKYGLSLSANDYYTNTTHTNNLIGIGTTNGTIKHSSSNANGFLLDESSTTLNASNEYVFAGHDGTTHDVTNSLWLADATVRSANVTTRWAREYRLEKTGNVNLTIGFDYAQAGFSRVSNTPSDYVLLYRASTGSTNYTMVSLSGSPDLSISDRVSFTVTNANLANGYYTLGLKTSIPAATLYTYNANCNGGCDLENSASWTTNPTGATLVGAMKPRTIDNIVILNGNTVNVNGTFSVNSATINTGGTFNLGISDNCSIATLSGSGTLKLATSAGTLVFPSITTNNFITTAGNTVEYSSNNSFSLPSTPATYRNLTLSGGGTKSTPTALTVNETFLIQPPTTFSTTSNLNLNGHLVNNGQFNQAIGTTTFGGTMAQNISGAPTTTIFNHLTISNSGGTVSSSIDFSFTGNFTNTSNVATAFNASSGTIISSSNSAQSIGGAGSGSVNFFNLYTSGTGLKTIGRSFSVNNLLSILGSSSLQFPASGTAYSLTVKDFTNSGTLSMATPGSATNHILTISGNVVLNNSSVFNVQNGTNVANLTFTKTGVQTISGGNPTTVSLNNVTINSGSETLLSDFNLTIRSNLTVDGIFDLGSQTANRASAGGTLLITTNGTLKIGGTNTFPTNYTTNTLTAGSTVEYSGSNQSVRAFTYSNLAISGGGNKTLAGATTVNAALTLNNGILVLATRNLLLPVTSTIDGLPGATSNIDASSSGAIRRYFNGADSFTFPVGTGSVYSPLTLTITSASFSGGANTRYVALRSIGSAAPSQLDDTYSITKYWTTTVSRISNVNGSITATYDVSEANPTAEPFYGNAYYNGSSWSVGATSTVASQVVTFALSSSTLTGNWTAGPSVDFIASTFYSIANANFEDGGTWSVTGFAGAAFGLPPTLGSAVRIGNNKTVLATSGSKSLSTVTIDATGTLDLGTTSGNTISTLNGTGTLRITAIAAGTADFPAVATNNFISGVGSTVEYYGTDDYNLPSTPTTYNKLAITGAGSTKLILANTTVTNSLVLNSGLIALGNLNLSLGASATITGSSPSAGNMILANGNGSVRKFFDGVGSFTFPVGTNGVYTPATFNLTIALFGGGTGSRFIALRPVEGMAPNQLDATYSLAKHWVVSSTNLSLISSTLAFTYDLSERNATAEPIYTNAVWNGSWTTGGVGGSVVSPVVNFSTIAAGSLNGTYTAGPLVAFAAGNFYSIANGDFETGSSWSTSSYFGAATVIPPTVGSTVNIGNNKTVTMTSNSKTLTTVTVDGGFNPGVLDISTASGINIGTLSGSGTIRISANGGTALFPTVATNNFINTAGNTIEYYGTSDYTLPSSPATFRNLTISGSGTKTISATTSVQTTLNLNSGLLELNNFNLLFPVGSNYTGTPSATNMIVTSGTGVVRRYFDAVGSFTFPIGTGSVYTPGTINLTTATFGGAAGSRFIDVRAINSVAPNQLDASYSLAKHWAILSTNISGISATLNFKYDLSERNAVAEPIYTNAYWNGASWTVSGTVAAQTASFTRTGAANLNGNWTAGPSVAFIPGNFYSIANGNFENASTWSLASYVGAATVIPPTVGSTVNIGNNRTVTATAGSKNLTTVNIDGVSPGTLDLSTFTGISIGTLNGFGKLRISATGGTAVFPTVTTNNFIGTVGSTVEYYGTANYNLPSSPTTFRNLTLTGAGTKTLSASTTINTTLNMNSGVLNIAGFNLYFPVGSNYSGTPSATNKIIASGAGVIRRYFNAIGNFTFPVGTGSVYTPASINLTSATFNGAVDSRFIDLKAINAVAPNQLDATYSLTKYWVIASTNLSNISASLSMTYDLSERNALAESIYVPGFWNGSLWTVGLLSGVVSPVISFSTSGAANLNGNYSAGPSGAFLPGSYYSRATGSFETANTWSQVSYFGVASAIPPTNGSDVYVGNNFTVTASAGSKTIKTLQIVSGSTLDLQNNTGISITTFNGAGTLRLSATSGTAIFPTVTTNNFISSAGSTVEYYGTGNYNLPASPNGYQNLTLTGIGSTKTLLANTTVNQALTMNSGILDLTSFHLILPIGNSLSGTPSASNFIRTSGTGVVRKYFNAAGVFNFPLGTGAAYTPLNLNFTSATFGGVAGSRYLEVSAVGAKAPSQLDDTYSLNKYWKMAATNISSVSGNITATYDASEPNALPAVEAIYGSAKYIGGVWTTGTTASISSRAISFPLSSATLTGNYTAGPNVGFLPGMFYSFASGSYESATTWSLTDFVGPVSPIPPTVGSNVRIGNNRTVTATAGSKTVPTVTIDGSPTQGTLDIQSFTGFSFNTLLGSGTIRISASGGTAVFPTVTTNTFISTAGNTVEYYGSANYNVPAGISTFNNLTLSGTGVKTLLTNTTVGNTLTMNSGILDIGNYHLILPSVATVSGNAPSSSNFVRTSGTGVVRKYLDAAGTFNFPIGTGSYYTPFNLIISAATFNAGPGTRFVDVRAIPSLAPSQLDNSYSLNKYWLVSSTNISNVTGSLAATYNGSEANANPFIEGIYGSAKYIGGVWTTGSLATIVGRVISFPLSGSQISGNYTAGPNVAFLPGTFYSFATGNYEDAATWSLNAFGGPVSPIPPTTGSFVRIGNNQTVTTTVGSKTVPLVTIDGDPASGTLDLQSFTGFNFTTLNGSGTLRISTASPTAVFPTIGTNNFISTAGNTVEYYGANNFNLPASPLVYKNLTISGGGYSKNLAGNTTVEEGLTISSGTLEIAGNNLSVTGATNVSGTLSDNANGGTNTFAGHVTVNPSGAISTSNGSPFFFGANLANNGTFNKTGTGAVTFNGGTQTVSGTSPITMNGTISLATGTTVQNSNNSFLLNNIAIGQNGKLVQQYPAFPTSYTGSNNGLGINTGFEVLSSSNNAGNTIISNTGDKIEFNLNGSGSVFGSRTIALAPAASAQVVRFDISTSSTSATSKAGTLIIGSGFANNATIHTATARMHVNLSATNGDFSITYPDGTPTTSGTLSGTQTIIWVINTSGSSVTYAQPNGAGAISLATGKSDLWIGNTRLIAGLNVQTAAQAMNNLKFVFNLGTGNISLSDLQVNPLGTINTSALAQTCYRVTPYDGDSVLVSFTTPGSMSASTHFNSGNTFTAQLSNSAGSFNTPIILGSLTTSALSGTIEGFIPANLATGSGYRIRVVSNLPISIPVNNGTNITINQFKIAPAPSQVITTAGTGTSLTATGLGVTGYQWGYYTILGGPITDLSGKTASTYTPQGPDFPGAGTYSLVCRMTTSGCGTNYSNYVAIYVNCPVTTNLVVNGDFSSGNVGFTSQYNYVADDPSVQNEMWPEQTYAVVNNPNNVHTNFCNMNTGALRSPGSAGNMLVGNAATSGSLKLWEQSITVTPNTDYVLTFWAVSLAGTESSLLFGIYTGCYRTGADVSVPFETFNCVWNRYSFQFNSGNATSIPLAIVNISAQAAGNDIAIDDINVYACASVSSPPFVVANAPFWRGITSDWFNKDNWGTTCSLPTCADDVYIPFLPSGKVYPNINAAGAAAKTVQIRSGAKLTLSSGYNLNICGDFDNSGTFTSNGTSSITFTGNSNPAKMMGSLTGLSKFTNVIINKANSNDTVMMAANVEIAENFTITKGTFKAKGFQMKIAGNYSNAGSFIHNNGYLEFNGASNSTFTNTGSGSLYDLKINKNSETNTVTFNPASTSINHQLDLTLGQVVTSGTNEVSVTNATSNAVINHSSSSYVRGRLRRALSGVTSYDYPVGDATRYELVNINVTNPLVGTSTLLGYFNSATAPGTTPNIYEGPKHYEFLCTNGYWTFTPNAQPSAGLYNFTMYPQGITCMAEHQTVAKRANSAAAWTFGGSTLVGSNQRNGFNSFSEFAQVSAEEPLPLNLISFFGTWKGDLAMLQWKTVNERDNSHFDVERSTDGLNFEKIGRVDRNAGSSDANSYDFVDAQPRGGVLYYRLKQMDLNGQFEYSRTIKLQNSLSKIEVQLSPNPWLRDTKLSVTFLDDSNGQYVMELVSTTGKVVSTQVVETKVGWNTFGLTPNQKIPAGLYFVNLRPVNGQNFSIVPIKLIIQ